MLIKSRIKRIEENPKVSAARTKTEIELICKKLRTFTHDELLFVFEYSMMAAEMFEQSPIDTAKYERLMNLARERKF